MQQVCFPVITTVTCNKCEHRIALIRGDKVPRPRRAEDQLCAVAPSPIAHRSWRWCSRPGALQGPPLGGSTAPPLQEGVHPPPLQQQQHSVLLLQQRARLHPLLRGVRSNTIPIACVHQGEHTKNRLRRFLAFRSFREMGPAEDRGHTPHPPPSRGDGWSPAAGGPKSPFWGILGPWGFLGLGGPKWPKLAILGPPAQNAPIDH